MTGLNIAAMKDLGVGVVAIIFLYLIIKMQMTNYKSSSDATNKVVQDNTKVINKLANALEKGNLLDEEFRRNMINTTNESKDLILEIQTKVTDIHEKVV